MAMADSTMIWRAIGVAWGSSSIGLAVTGSSAGDAAAPLGVWDIDGPPSAGVLRTPRSPGATLPDR